MTNEFIDLELQSEVANLRKDRDGYRTLYQSTRQALRDVLEEVAEGVLFTPKEAAFLKILTDGYKVSKYEQKILDKLNVKEPDEDYDFSDAVASAYDGSSTDANT